MARFAQFKSATGAEAPSYVQAEIERARIANQAKQAENARRSQNVMGGIALYNEAMGENTPIADYLADALRTGPAADPSSVVPVVDKSIGALPDVGDPSMYGAGMDFASAAPDAAALAEAGDAATTATDVSGVPVLGAINVAGNLAAGDVEGAAGSAAKTWLSTMGPYGMAAALAASLLGL